MAKKKQGRPAGGRPPGRRGKGGTGPGPAYRPGRSGKGTKHKSSSIEGGSTVAFLLHGYGVI